MPVFKLILSRYMVLTNRGQIEADILGETLTVRPGISPDLSCDKGLMVAVNGGILKLSRNAGGNFINTDGIICATENSHVLLAEGITIIGGRLETQGSGRFYTLRDTTLH